jgi:HK97 family phage major capsid protein
MNPRILEIEARKKEIRKLLESGDECDLNALETELKALNEEKTKLEKRSEMLKGIETGEIETRKLPAEVKKPEEGLRVFRNFGEQLNAIRNQALHGTYDERLNRLNKQNAESRAILGMNAGVGSDGGFAIQTDFAGTMMETAAKSGEILSRTDSYPITDNSDSVEWNDIDETSIATTVFGGVQVYWEAEAAEVTASSPKLVKRQLELKILMGIAYATYNLERDSNFVSDLYTRAFTEAINRELESCVVSGTGVGKPLGFLSSGSIVTITKETGQAADTVYWENIVKMFNRQLNKSNSIWLMNPDVQEQLDFLQFPVGVGGVPVYLPASAVGTVPSLKGRPVVESDQCSAIGDVGDINFVDLDGYLMIYKGGIDAQTSIHVQFLTAQNCFRFMFSANGMPKKNSTLTIKNSSNARSKFITLGAR